MYDVTWNIDRAAYDRDCVVVSISKVDCICLWIDCNGFRMISNWNCSGDGVGCTIYYRDGVVVRIGYVDSVSGGVDCDMRRISSNVNCSCDCVGCAFDYVYRVGWMGIQRRNQQDRKSTRLNSSHANISYAVFCLKKKKIQSIKRYQYK